MPDDTLNIVTGACGYSGRYITRLLLAAGQSVRTLTGHPDRPNPFGDQVPALPLSFDDPDRLAKSLEGADTLFNTYWVRFEHKSTTFAQAVSNSRTLIQSAAKAGLRRIVHISITNPDPNSDLPYFAGKAAVEQLIRQSALSYAILRPTVLFGGQDILINNIAWMLRHFPIFVVPGNGTGRLQPIHVEDLADLAVRSAKSQENIVLDAVGPEVFSFDQMVRLVRKTFRSKTLIMRLPARLALLLSGAVGLLFGDVTLTSDEVKGLAANLLVSHAPPTATTKLSDYLLRNRDSVGRQYHNELKRHFS